MTFADLGILLLSAILLFVIAFTGKGRKLDRAEGLVFLACYATYMAWLIINL